MRFDDRRPLEQAEDVRGRRLLTSQRPERVDLREERRARALQRLDRLSACEIGGGCEAAGANEPERCERGHELRAVDERETLLRLEPHRLEAGALQRVATREPLAREPGITLADEW